jgi:hypothetical protein
VGLEDEVVVVCDPLVEGFEVLWLLAELVELGWDCEELEEITVEVEDGDEELEDSEFVVPEPPPTLELLV